MMLAQALNVVDRVRIRPLAHATIMSLALCFSQIALPLETRCQNMKFQTEVCQERDCLKVINLPDSTAQHRERERERDRDRDR